MSIGQHVAKFLAEKESAQADESREAKVMADAGIEPPKKDPTMAQVLMQFAELLKEMKESQGGVQQKEMLNQAEILQQILIKTKPENVAPPLIGVYTYPEGERDRPKPALKCKMTWVGYELDPNVLTPDEIDALNALPPGVTRVTKADSTKIEFRVTPVHNSNLELERLDIWFPCKGEQRHNHGSMLSYCRQAVGTATPDVNDLIAQLEDAKRQLAARAA